MLKVDNIFVNYGGIQAIRGISLEVQENSIVGLIGANGAGKSTTLKAISGLVPINTGHVLFEGRRIDGRNSEKIASFGIILVPEGKRLFLGMTILDNLLTGAYLRSDNEKIESDLERIYGYFPVLKDAKNRLASDLSGGEQQMLAIARGLMADPKLLLLDEPSLGLSPLLTKEVGEVINRIYKDGVSILLVEQNANLAFKLVEKIYVMETGTITVEGDPSLLKEDPHVREAYLGIVKDEEKPEIIELKNAETHASERAIRSDKLENINVELLSNEENLKTSTEVQNRQLNERDKRERFAFEKSNVETTFLNWRDQKNIGIGDRWENYNRTNLEMKENVKGPYLKKEKLRVVKKSFVPKIRSFKRGKKFEEE